MNCSSNEIAHRSGKRTFQSAVQMTMMKQQSKSQIQWLNQTDGKKLDFTKFKSLEQQVFDKQS